MSYKRSEELGLRVIELLALKQKGNTRVDTTWGEKTPMGLGLTIRRLVKEVYGEKI